ncbi:hypothetical protein Lesp02_36420 [Lentzea sp. NBRC 105346]|nr:hypothetical protein Lesp02_36420 [Lentzea sp. NBRC 105346]
MSIKPLPCLTSTYMTAAVIATSQIRTAVRARMPFFGMAAPQKRVNIGNSPRRWIYNQM